MAELDLAGNPDRLVEIIVAASHNVIDKGLIPWPQVEEAAQGLANSLRSKDSADHRTALGQSALPKSIVTLLGTAYGHEIPTTPPKLATFEMLRVAANLCMDHDVNRQQFLDAGLLDILLSLIGLHRQLANPSADDLKVAKTAVGSMLNACLGYEPAKLYLRKSGAPGAVISLSLAIYPPGEWTSRPETGENVDSISSLYQIRIGLVDWSWRVVSAINEGAEVPPIGLETLGPLVLSLSNFVPTRPAQSPLINDVDSRNALIVADLEALEESVTLLEALSLDSEEVRLAFAESPEADKLLGSVLDFIELANYPQYWSLDGEEERKRREKHFDVCKAGVIKALISIAGEQKAMDSLWNKDGLVKRMVSWVTSDLPIQGEDAKRDDLVIAGCLTLGNISRKDAYSEALLREPFNLAPQLIKFLQKDEDIKVKHSVTGLLKNLAQASSNRKILGESGVLEQLTRSGIWEKECDMAETVQVSAIGITKHLCNSDANNTLRLMSGPSPNGVDQIQALVERSDSVIVKSEGTRVLAYCVKSLWRKDPAPVTQSTTTTDIPQQDTTVQRREAAYALSRTPIVRALVDLLVTGQKHTILLNESSFALTLIASKPEGATNIAIELFTPVQIPQNPAQNSAIQLTEEPQSSQANSGSSNGAASLKSVVSNDSGKHPPELRANACSLIGTLLRNLTSEASKSLKEQVVAEFSDSLTAVSQDKDSPEKLVHAAKWALGGP
ncbi:hypothetical protein FRC18_003052 [Serendipita sp. 400]|nr:hypothetical protein FRC18_003052 [Serendipita sp. 400]